MAVTVTKLVCLSVLGLSLSLVTADNSVSAKPRVPLPVTPKPKRLTRPPVYTPPQVSQSRSVPGRFFPWKRDITATIFWIGEEPTPKNPTPNHASSWDQKWEVNYGGFDNPNPRARARDYRPLAFIPKLNPFYVALPYNDIDRSGTKSEASRVVPWFHKRFKKNGWTTLKGQWLAIKYKGKTCYAQWEDCGPFVTDDWPYVFGNARPKNRANKQAGIDVSPAVRDYLKLKSGDKVSWRFVSDASVRRGPWKYYGKTTPRRGAGRPARAYTPPPKPTIEELYEQRQRATRGSVTKRKYGG